MKSSGTKVDPLHIYVQASAFCKAFQMIANTQQDEDRIRELGAPITTLSVFASELMLKCLICIETGKAPSGHLLKLLFDRLSKPLQARIETRWNETVVPMRLEMWKRMESALGGRSSLGTPARSCRGQQLVC